MDRGLALDGLRTRGMCAVGAGLVFSCLTSSAPATELSPVEPSSAPVQMDYFTQVLPGPLSPLEDAGDLVLRSLFRMLPARQHLPGHLQERDHEDYPWFSRWIPRGWTAFGWGKPTLLFGNQITHLGGAPKPIGEKGSYQISRYPDLPAPLCWLPLYFAFTTPGGVHVRLGARWDDVDSYTQFPSVAVKRLKPKPVIPVMGPARPPADGRIRPLPEDTLQTTQTAEQKPG